MTEPARLTSTPAGVRLCRLDDIADPGARGFVLQMRAGRFHGFVVRQGTSAHGYLDRCPHAGLTLARALDDYLVPDGAMIACGWHGAVFDAASGACLGGPCSGGALTRWPVALVDGWIVTD